MMSVLKQPSSETFIKVRYHCQGKPKNKMVSLKTSDYLLLCNKIVQGIALDTNKMYSMFYLDNSKQPILVNNQEDLDIMIQAAPVPLSLELEETDIPDHNFMQAILEMKEEEAVQRKEAQLREMEEYKQEIKAELEQQIRINLKSQFMKAMAARDQTIVEKEQIIAQKDKKIEELNVKMQSIPEKLESKKQEVLAQLRVFKSQVQAEAQAKIKQRLNQYLKQMEQKKKREQQQKKRKEQQKKKREQQQKKRKEQQKKKSGFLHRGVACQGKQCLYQSAIRGVRYQCLNCTDFNFCERCESSQRHIESHVFCKIYKETQQIPSKYISNGQELTKVEKSHKTPAKKQAKHEQNSIQEEMISKIILLKQMGINQNDIKSLLERHPNQSVNFLTQKYFEEQDS